MSRENPIRLAVATLLGAHAGLLFYGACVHSPTLNEPAHLVAGISYWRFGRFDLYKVNPPLVRLLSAIPVLLSGSAMDWHHIDEGPLARPEFVLGEDFVAANGEWSLWLFTMARWTCIPLSLLGAVVCYRWAKELYGPGPGLLALTLWCFCPNIIAHGQLITPDAAATSLAVAACYTFWRWLKEPTWWHTLVSGIVLGVAELANIVSSMASHVATLPLDGAQPWSHRRSTFEARADAPFGAKRNWNAVSAVRSVPVRD